MDPIGKVFLVHPNVLYAITIVLIELFVVTSIILLLTKLSFPFLSTLSSFGKVI